MKKLYILLLAGASFFSCSKDDSPQVEAKGMLVLKTSATSDVILKEAISTGNFNVTIKNNATNAEAYNNTVSSITNPLNLPAGTYTVTVKSENFTTPAFNKPVYVAAKSDVSITWGATTDLSLICKQANAGVKVVYATAFTDYCTTKGYDFGATVSDGTNNLDYGKKSTSLTTNAGYFMPGNLTVKITMNGVDYTKAITVAAQELVTVNVNVNTGSSAPRLAVSVAK
jgi:hypothetical protein